MEVFPEDWIQEFRKRYEQHAAQVKPELYYLVTEEENSNYRANIQRWVDLLPPASQNDVVSRLRKVELCRETYNELLAGEVLRNGGYNPEYEKLFGTLTPDWYIDPGDNKPPFLVEVFTARISDEEEKEQNQIDDLRNRLAQIPIKVSVWLDRYPDRLHGKIDLNPKRNKAIVQKVQNWLSTNPAVGARLELEDMAFDVIGWSPDFTGIQMQGPVKNDMVDDEPLEKKINKKIRKYTGIVNSGQVPLVVAVLTDFETGLGFDELENVTLGRLAVSYNQNGPLGLVRQNDGLFQNKPELSAAAYIYKENGNWKIKLIRNPTARFPLPPDVL